AFASRAWPLDLDLDLLDTVLGRCRRGGLGRPLSGERRALAAPLEADRAGRGPAEGIAVGVGDRDRRVIEGRLDVHDRPADVASCLSLLGLRHGSVAPWLLSSRIGID